jgi:hypothetical protein
LVQKPLRSLVLPRIRKKTRKKLAISACESDAYGGETLSPPDLFTGLRGALDCGQDSALVEHHVHPILIPQRCEDLASDPKRGTPVMNLFDGLG